MEGGEGDKRGEGWRGWRERGEIGGVRVWTEREREEREREREREVR